MSDAAQGSAEVATPDAGATPAPEPQATPAPTPTPAPEPAGDGWMPAFEDTDMQGWYDNKQFKDPQTMAKSYYHLEKLNGALKNGNAINKPSEHSEPAEWDHYYNQLGRPKLADEYGFITPENKDDVGWVAELMHKTGVTDKQGTAIVEAFNERSAAAITNNQEQQVADAQAAKSTWEKSQGAALEGNIASARGAAREFGLDNETIDSLESALGYGKLMDFLSNVGNKVGQDTYQDGSTNAGLMTPQSAKAAMNDLMLDPDFMQAFMNGDHAGHAAAVAKKQRLTRMMAGENPNG